MRFHNVFGFSLSICVSSLPSHRWAGQLVYTRFCWTAAFRAELLQLMFVYVNSHYLKHIVSEKCADDNCRV